MQQQQELMLWEASSRGLLIFYIYWWFEWSAATFMYCVVFKQRLLDDTPRERNHISFRVPARKPQLCLVSCHFQIYWRFPHSAKVFEFCFLYTLRRWWMAKALSLPSALHDIWHWYIRSFTHWGHIYGLSFFILMKRWWEWVRMRIYKALHALW